MTTSVFTFSRPQVRASRSRNCLAATCVAALLALHGFTATGFAQTSGALDTSTLRALPP